VLVPDVQAFPGHIACDARSKSEVVVPLMDSEGKVVAVLDVDADRFDAFGEVDVEGLSRICASIQA
jgi:GAF domain-containing protein